VEYPSDLIFGWESEINHNKLRLNSSWNLISTSTWWTHRSYKLNILNFFKDLILGSIEPSSIIHPLSHQLKRRLGSISIFFRHVQIVDINYHFFAIWDHLCLCPSCHFTLYHFLSFYGTSLTWKYDVCNLPRILVQLI
jgi:hypothetical protein